MRLFLIRHGITEANEKRLYCGSTDLPLSRAGVEQLQTLHYDLPCDNYVISGMRRTEETLKILFGDVHYTVEPGFREVDFGRFEMQSYLQLKDREDYQRWLSGDNEVNVPPEGESGAQMRQRVLEALARLNRDTVLITHGGVIAAIMAHLFPQEGKSRYEWQPPNGGGYQVWEEGYCRL
ncbi:MAG: histidine phosphatase family protein [Oscillospiraceae bacterium]|nr:histidine phosphatase family protein [Oscillospiraceae bacterium]